MPSGWIAACSARYGRKLASRSKAARATRSAACQSLSIIGRKIILMWASHLLPRDVLRHSRENLKRSAVTTLRITVSRQVTRSRSGRFDRPRVPEDDTTETFCLAIAQVDNCAWTDRCRPTLLCGESD